MWDYGLVLFVIGLLASFAGQALLNWIVEKYRRKSYIISLIGKMLRKREEKRETRGEEDKT